VTEEMVAVLIIRTAIMVAVLIMSSSHRNKDRDHDSNPHKNDCDIIIRSSPHNKDCDHNNSSLLSVAVIIKRT